MKRVKVIVEWLKSAGQWRVTSNRPGSDPWKWTTKRKDAVGLARYWCRNLWAVGQPCELKIRNRTTGKWSTEGSTYGRDPRRTKG